MLEKWHLESKNLSLYLENIYFLVCASPVAQLANRSTPNYMGVKYDNDF